VQLIGVDLCTTQFSPPPEGCPTDPVVARTLTVTVAGNPAGAGSLAASVISAPAGVACSKAADGPNQTCAASFPDNTTVALTTTTSGTVVYTGECVQTSPTQATVILNGANRTCTATVQP
jgi:hypothetical protein